MLDCALLYTDNLTVGIRSGNGSEEMMRRRIGIEAEMCLEQAQGSNSGRLLVSFVRHFHPHISSTYLVLLCVSMLIVSAGFPSLKNVRDLVCPPNTKAP